MPVRREGQMIGPNPAALEASEALSRYGFHLTESARKYGIDFKHEAPTLDVKLGHIMPLIASMGAAVSVVDFDGDGLLDIYVINSKEGSKNRAGVSSAPNLTELGNSGASGVAEAQALRAAGVGSGDRVAGWRRGFGLESSRWSLWNWAVKANTSATPTSWPGN